MRIDSEFTPSPLLAAVNRVIMARISEPGMSIIDPHIRLGYAIVKNAFIELQDVDPVTSFDALCWWLEDAGDWLDMLDLYTQGDGRYFDLVVQSEVIKNG